MPTIERNYDVFKNILNTWNSVLKYIVLTNLLLYPPKSTCSFVISHVKSIWKLSLYDLTYTSNYMAGYVKGILGIFMWNPSFGELDLFTEWPKVKAKELLATFLWSRLTLAAESSGGFVPPSSDKSGAVGTETGSRGERAFPAWPRDAVFTWGFGRLAPGQEGRVLVSKHYITLYRQLGSEIIWCSSFYILFDILS